MRHSALLESLCPQQSWRSEELPGVCSVLEDDLRPKGRIFGAVRTFPRQTKLTAVFCFITICLMSFLQKLYFFLKDAFSCCNLSCDTFLIISCSCFGELAFHRCSRSPLPSIRVISSESVSNGNSLDVPLLSRYDEMTLTDKFPLLIHVEMETSDRFSLPLSDAIILSACYDLMLCMPQNAKRSQCPFLRKVKQAPCNFECYFPFTKITWRVDDRLLLRQP